MTQETLEKVKDLLNKQLFYKSCSDVLNLYDGRIRIESRTRSGYTIDREESELYNLIQELIDDKLKDIDKQIEKL